MLNHYILIYYLFLISGFIVHFSICMLFHQQLQIASVPSLDVLMILAVFPQGGSVMVLQSVMMAVMSWTVVGFLWTIN